MQLSTLFYIGIMLGCGLLFGRLAKLVKLPNVTGYLVAGLLIGPHVLNIVPEGIVGSMSIVSEIALGFIAFSIGGEFKASYFKRVGMAPIIIAVLEGVMAILFVFGGLLAAGFPFELALLLGAIASATAPAATVMVIRQYKARGPVTETLLSVVALDDAVALIGFGVSAAIVSSLGPAAADTSVLMAVLQSLYEVFVSLAVGGAMGFLMGLPLRWFKKSSNRLCITAAAVFLTCGLATLLHGSSLLACMALGAGLINFWKEAPKVLDIAGTVTPPIFMLFFVVSGAELNLSVIPTIGLVGILYLVMRVAGKMFGAWLGGTLSHASPPVRKYLGPALIPQAGVAIGLSLVAETAVPEYAPVIRAVILCATLIYELVGPAIVKISLTKAGEIPASKTDGISLSK